jgi:hypothetical protein
MKVSELSGAELDYWVARAEGIAVAIGEDTWEIQKWGERAVYWYGGDGEIGGTMPIGGWGSPSTNWSDGGPIIERERIRLEAAWIGELKDEIGWLAERQFEGKTALIAAMRAFVASKFGEEVSDGI